MIFWFICGLLVGANAGVIIAGLLAASREPQYPELSDFFEELPPATHCLLCNMAFGSMGADGFYVYKAYGSDAAVCTQCVHYDKVSA